MESELSRFILPLAVILDLLLGDPRWLPHPIRWMGNAIAFFEPRFRRLKMTPKSAGFFFALFLILAAGIISKTITAGAGLVGPDVWTVVEIILIYYCLSIKSLDQAARAVYQELINSRLGKSKEKLSMIVGREVDGLDAEGVARAAVETVAENFVDGVVSPLLFAAIGGAPLCVAYKMINTLDSMVGYKNEKYIDFGCAAAHMDDVANYIPSRLSIFLISLGAWILSGNAAVRAFMTALKDGRRHASPNAGWPEATFAGALRLKLGGPNYYHGRRVEKPYIGSAFSSAASPDHIRRACELMLLCSLISLVIVWFVP